MLTLPFQTRRRRAFIEEYSFPSTLRVKLRETFTDDRQVAIALEGLREWYLVCLAARGRMLGMPSKAVDVAWHEMILMTREYHWFCEHAFGSYLHHTPESEMDVPMRSSLATTLALVENQGLTVAGVPLLFAVDQQMDIEDGYFWQAHDLERIRASRDSVQIMHGGGSSASTAPIWGGCGADGGGGCGGGGCGGGG